MKTDLQTVMWKEWKSLFREGGSRAKIVASLMAPLLLAVYFPFEVGARWVSDPIVSLLPCIATVLVLVILTIPDSFAGERERHTLETLLASRLPDRAILFGKLVVSMAVAMSVALLVLGIGLVTVNILHWGDGPLFYSPRVLFIDLALSFFFAVITAGAGVIISLRAETAQEAQQMLAAALMVPGLILGMIPPVLLSLRPEWRGVIRETLASAGYAQVMSIIVGVGGVIGAGLIWVAVGRFERHKLISP
jgi:ABC-2 type transport system permease protein